MAERVAPARRRSDEVAGDYHHTFILTLCRLLGAHVADAERLTADAAAVREHLSRPDTITCQPLLWQAWGVRP